MPITPAHPGTLDVTLPTQTSLDRATAKEIADIVMRFGSQSFLIMPWLVALSFTGVALAILGTTSPGSEKELAQLLGLLVGPFVLMGGFAFLCSVLLGYLRKVRAGIALQGVDLEPGLRARAYRAGLRRRRSIGAIFIRRRSLRERVLQEILVQAPARKP